MQKEYLKKARRLPLPARNRRHQQHLIPLLEGVAGSSQEADIFLIHIDVEETAHLAGLVAQVRLQLGKLLIEDGEQFFQIRRGASD